MKGTPLFCLVSVCSMHWQLLGQPALQSPTNELQEQSPRLNRLKSQLAGGDRLALGRFWESLAVEHTPILEPISNETQNVLVTFIWRGNAEKTVSVAGRDMTRLAETDLWFSTSKMDSRIPIFY